MTTSSAKEGTTLSGRAALYSAITFTEVSFPSLHFQRQLHHRYWKTVKNGTNLLPVTMFHFHSLAVSCEITDSRAQTG